MASLLHVAVAGVAKERGAMVISKESLRALALQSLHTAVAFGQKAPVEIATGNKLVAGRFSAISIDPSRLVAILVSHGDSLAIEVQPGFEVSVELLVPGGGPAYSIITLNVPPVRFPLTTSATSVHFEAPSEMVDASVVPASTRDAAIADSGIDADELLRVEGSIAYGTGSRLINSALGTLPPIDLVKMFPAFEFGGELELVNVDGSLVVIPESFRFVGNTGCPKGDATDGLEISPQRPTDVGTTRTWPVLVRTPTPPKRVQPLSDDGLVAAYLPKPLMDVQFGKTSPAVTYRDHGNGFIGYDVELSAAIRGVTVTIDTTERALRLRLDFASWGLAVATIDVPCVGRMDLAQARFEMPKDNGTGFVEAIVRLGVDTAGRLLMLTELGKTDLGEAMVSVQLFSKYAGMAGGEAAVYGFIADAVIGRVIAHNLPGLVFDAIKAAVNQHFFVLADLSGITGSLEYLPNRPTWSDDGASALMGLVISR